MNSISKTYEEIADAKITGGLVLRISIRDFQRLKQIVKDEFSDALLIYSKAVPGKLWLKEGEEK